VLQTLSTRAGFRHALLALALAGTLLSLAYMPFIRHHKTEDTKTYLAAASAILHGNYTTPLQAGFYTSYGVVLDVTGLPIARRAWNAPERQVQRPPVYPLVLAALGGGKDGVSRDAVYVFQAILFGVAVWFLGLMLHRWAGPTFALVATTIYVLDPFSKRYASLVLSEQVTLVLVVFTAYAFTRAWQDRSTKWWALASAGAALATLTRLTFFLAVPLIVLCALIRQPRGRARIVAALSSVAVAVALLGPWVAYTDSVTGQLSLAVWGEGTNLLMAADGEGMKLTYGQLVTDPQYHRDLTSPHHLYPGTQAVLTDPDAHPRYVAADDSALRRRAWSRYWSGLKHHPAAVVRDFFYRAFYLWDAHKDWYQPAGGIRLFALRLLDGVTILLAAIGIVMAFLRGGAPRAIALFLLLYTVVTAVHHVEARFAIPLRGLFLAFAAFPLIWLYARVKGRGRVVSAASELPADT
jgi:4-amino-4-deoxy-L-arabinose transferase-like glycosyltransferase